MNFLLGKEKKSATYSKILSDQVVFSYPDGLENTAYEYDPETIIESDEWYQISGFGGKEYCLEILKQVFSSAEYDKLLKIEGNNLEQLLFVDGDIFYFQKVTPSKYIAQQKILSYKQSGEFKVEELEDAVYLDDVAHAIYNRKLDVLYFKNINKITSIFPGIINLYKEATEEETNTFLQSQFINAAEGYTAKKVKTENRKRIALAVRTLAKLKKNEQKTIFGYIKDYCPELKCEQDKFSVASEKDLRLLLWGIEERYFTKPVTGDKCVANSAITLTTKQK